MAEQTWGKVTAVGDDEFLTLVRKALDEAAQGEPLPDLFENLPPDPYRMEEHTPAEFKAKGYVIPGTNIAAYGYAINPHLLWINRRLVRRQPKKARHVCRHEVSHTLDGAYLDSDKRGEIMLLMEREDGSHPTRWRRRTKYENRPSEAYADSMSEAVSGIDSPWDDFAYYGCDMADNDVHLLVPITFDGNPGDGELPEVDPLPPIDACEQEVADLKEERDKLAEQVTKVKGIVCL